MEPDGEEREDAGSMEVRMEWALSTMRNLTGNHQVSIEQSVGTKGYVAMLEVHGTGDNRRHAVVSTPGDMWFSLDVDGGFSLDHFEEETSRQDVRQLIERYYEIAIAYVMNGARPADGRRMRTARHIEVAGEDVVLTLGVPQILRGALRSGLKALRRKGRPG